MLPPVATTPLVYPPDCTPQICTRSAQPPCMGRGEGRGFAQTLPYNCPTRACAGRNAKNAAPLAPLTPLHFIHDHATALAQTPTRNPQTTRQQSTTVTYTQIASSQIPHSDTQIHATPLHFLHLHADLSRTDGGAAAAVAAIHHETGPWWAG